ncbi:MAG: vWA domain-containing protein [Myxococcaceae bacterium]
MHRTLTIASLVAVAAITAGCPNDKLAKTLPPDVRVDTYSQQSASKIDVLWVVDNSGSMAARQTNLARNFTSFIDVFTKQSVDYRIAITTTDIFNNPGSFHGTPAIIKPTTPNVVQTFANNIKVGTSGSAYEAGLEAAAIALDRQGAANQPKLDAIDTCKGNCGKSANVPACVDGCYAQNPVDFIRPDAYLYIVFVSDEEDKSTSAGGDLRYYWRKFETANGIGNDGTVTTAAIIGDVPSNSCQATPGTRYVELSKLTGGEVGSICDAEFATTLRKLATSAVGLKRKFALGQAPNISTIEVRVLYPCNVPSDVTAGCQVVDSSACKDQPAESYNLVCTPPQGGADGWSYEPSTQVIFFSGDSVPGVNAHLEIQYYEEGKP